LLAWAKRPVRSSKPIRSVNVPPMSTATTITPFPPARGGRRRRLPCAGAATGWGDGPMKSRETPKGTDRNYQCRGGKSTALTELAPLVTARRPEARHAGRQGTGCALLDRGVGRAHARQGGGGPDVGLARHSVRGGTCAGRPRRHHAHLFRRTHVGQARRRGAPLRSRQDREPGGAGRNRAVVPVVRRGAVGGGAAAGGARGDVGRGDAVGVRHH